MLEAALEGEMDAHLGYAKHDPAGRDGGNSRNGHRAKTVLSDVGEVGIEVPRDRDASFAPQIVAKRQRRLGGIDDLVISLVAKGQTSGEVQAHLAEIYGVQVSRETVSKITDRVLETMADWQSRPLDAVYAVLFIDCINVKIRDGNVANRPIYTGLAVTADGERDILGLWAGEHGDGEGWTNRWKAALNAFDITAIGADLGSRGFERWGADSGDRPGHRGLDRVPDRGDSVPAAGAVLTEVWRVPSRAGAAR